jgi:hypothetical protein
MKQLDQNPGIQKQLDEKFEKVRSDTGKRWYYSPYSTFRLF